MKKILYISSLLILVMSVRATGDSLEDLINASSQAEQVSSGGDVLQGEGALAAISTSASDAKEDNSKKGELVKSASPTLMREENVPVKKEDAPVPAPLIARPTVVSQPFIRSSVQGQVEAREEDLDEADDYDDSSSRRGAYGDRHANQFDITFHSRGMMPFVPMPPFVDRPMSWQRGNERMNIGSNDQNNMKIKLDDVAIKVDQGEKILNTLTQQMDDVVARLKKLESKS